MIYNQISSDYNHFSVIAISLFISLYSHIAIAIVISPAPAPGFPAFSRAREGLGFPRVSGFVFGFSGLVFSFSGLLRSLTTETDPDDSKDLFMFLSEAK